jgi:glycosyltransferase involved in cell wall biosynthesis
MTRKNSPRVSIGMPIFNGEDYAAEAFDSLLQQTFSDFELIVSDNASTDRTEEICRAYAARDQRIRYFRSETNLGAAKNYNRVFSLSSGEYFKWAAHDDLCAPAVLERCVEVLDREEAVVLCYARSLLIDEQGEIMGSYADGLDLRSPDPLKRYGKFLKRQGLYHPIFGVIRSSALRETALIGNYHSSDRVLLAELILHGEFCELPDELFFRRIHPLISTTAHPSDSERTAWFDPERRGKVIFPRWRRLIEYLKGIMRAPLSWPQRAMCYILVGQFVLYPRRWLGLIGDVLKAAGLALSSLLRRERSSVT